MPKNDKRSQEQQTAGVGKAPYHAPAIAEIASIVDYKINEFVRLGGRAPIQYASTLNPHLWAGAGGPSEALLPAVLTYVDFLAELEKIRRKIQDVLDAIQPPLPEDGLDLPIPPPVPPTPGTRKMRQALEVMAAAKTAAENAEPNLHATALKKRRV